MGRVLFGMIENLGRPVGGVKVIFQAVGALRRRGFDAYVAATAATPGWLAGSRALDDVAILDMTQTQQITPDDLYVATDAIGPHRMPLLLGRPQRRVLFVQNHNALAEGPLVDWSRLTHIRCLTVSEFSRRYLLEQAGFHDVAVVAPGVDTTVFRPGTTRRHRIAYMPRKLRALADKLRAESTPAVEWIPIDNATEEKTADILRSSSVFLNLGRKEGFGLPPLEAMAAGCVVCGFAGQGTTDFATPRNGFWVREGDVQGCLRAIDEALAAAADPARAASVIQAGQETAARFSLTAFEDAMAAYIGALM